MNQITDQLWVSDIDSAQKQSTDRFDRVITVCQTPITDNVGNETAYEWYQMADGENFEYGGNSNYALFERATDSVVDALERGETVLVHCHAGRSRSVAVCIAAHATTWTLSVREAAQRVSNARNQANPCDHLWGHIEQYVNGRDS